MNIQTNYYSNYKTFIGFLLLISFLCFFGCTDRDSKQYLTSGHQTQTPYQVLAAGFDAAQSNSSFEAQTAPKGTICDHESVFDQKVLSPSGQFYAQELAPKDQGLIGLIYANNNQPYRTFQVTNHEMEGVSNPLKSIAWSPDSRRIATMFHYGSGGHIELVDALSGTYLHTYKLHSFCHCPYFSKDGKSIICGSRKITLNLN